MALKLTDISELGPATFAGDVTIADSKKLYLGGGNDLRIYHVADSNSYIEEHGAGALVFKSNDFYFQSTASATALQITPGGAVTVSGGNLTLGGTGRIQGIDTVSASTDAANKTYVDTQITNLIGGAPGALDTLNELAAAIGDDASYASSITTLLALKAPLASPSFTGNITGTGYLNLSAGYGSSKGIYLYGNPAMYRSDATTLDFPLANAVFGGKGKISILGTNNITISGTDANHCGLSFATNAILPCTVSVTNTNTVDLGASSEKFKDFYYAGVMTGGSASFTGDVTINKDAARLVLQDTGTGNALNQWISYRDSAGTERGYMGYGSTGNSIFYIQNTLSDLELHTSSGWGQKLSGTQTTFRGDIAIPSGDIMAANGTVTNPSITFNSDPDLGIYRNTTNQMTLVAAGEAVGLIHSGGMQMHDNDIDYVHQLHFNDNVRFVDEGNDSYLRFKFGDASAGGIKFYDGNDNLHGYFYADGDDSIGILDSGGSWAVQVDNDVITALKVADVYRVKATTTGVELSGDVTVGTASGNSTTTIFGNTNNLVLRSQTSGTRTPELKFNISGTDVWQIQSANNRAGVATNTLLFDQGSNGIKHYFFTDGNVTHVGYVTATYFRDADNTSYYVDPANTGTSLNVAGNISHTGLTPTAGTDIDQIYTASVSLQVTTSWQDTTVNAAELATGTYIVQLYTDDHGTNSIGHYTEYYSGIMSWYSTNTNNTETDEIILHRAGHAPNHGDVFLRTERTLSADTSDMNLQIKTSNNASGSATYVFKFRRMI